MSIFNLSARETYSLSLYHTLYYEECLEDFTGNLYQHFSLGFHAKEQILVLGRRVNSAGVCLGKLDLSDRLSSKSSLTTHKKRYYFNDDKPKRIEIN